MFFWKTGIQYSASSDICPLHDAAFRLPAALEFFRSNPLSRLMSFAFCLFPLCLWYLMKFLKFLLKFDNLFILCIFFSGIKIKLSSSAHTARSQTKDPCPGDACTCSAMLRREQILTKTQSKCLSYAQRSRLKMIRASTKAQPDHLSPAQRPRFKRIRISPKNNRTICPMHKGHGHFRTEYL